MKKIKLSYLFILISLFLTVAFPLNSYADAVDKTTSPKNWDDIAIKDEKTGIKITNYLMLLFKNRKEYFSLIHDYENKKWYDKGNFTSEAFRDIQERAKKSFTIEVSELDKNSPEMKNFINKFGKKTLKYKSKNGEEYSYYGYKIKVNKNYDGNFFRFATYDLSIPLKYKYKYKDENGNLLEKTKNSIWVEGAFICQNNKRDKNNIEEVRAWDYLPADEKNNAEVKLSEVNMNLTSGEAYIFLASGNIPNIPKNMAPGEYTVPMMGRMLAEPGSMSMADNALDKTGVIKVDKYGNKTLFLGFHVITKGGLQGHLLRAKYKDSIKDEEKKFAGIVDYYTDERRQYPKTLSIPLKTDEYMKEIEVYVDAMDEFPQSFWATMNVEGHFAEGWTKNRTKINGLTIKKVDMNADGSYEADTTMLKGSDSIQNSYTDKKFKKTEGEDKPKYKITIKMVGLSYSY